MMGLFILGLLGLWLLFAIWLANKLTNYLWRNNRSQTTVITLARNLTKIVLVPLFILMPFWDQLIAYPKWQQLCSTTADFEWGPGMDEKKAFGRELIVYSEGHETTIFPNIHVTYFSNQFKDAKTGELVLNMPHADYYKAKGIFYLPSSSGDNRAIFLSTCYTSYKSQKINNYLNQFNLKVVEDKS